MPRPIAVHTRAVSRARRNTKESTMTVAVYFSSEQQIRSLHATPKLYRALSPIDKMEDDAKIKPAWKAAKTQRTDQ